MGPAVGFSGREGLILHQVGYTVDGRRRPGSTLAGVALTATVPGRMERLGGANGQPSAVVDYAHTPDSLDKILRLLRSLHPGGRLIAVFVSAGERDRVKRPIQGKVAAELADVGIVTTEDPRFELSSINIFETTRPY